MRWRSRFLPWLWALLGVTSCGHAIERQPSPEPLASAAGSGGVGTGAAGVGAAGGGTGGQGGATGPAAAGTVAGLAGIGGNGAEPATVAAGKGGAAQAGMSGAAGAAPQTGTFVDPTSLKSCSEIAPLALAGEARGVAALAFDDERVYFDALRGMSSVSKQGGDAFVLGPSNVTSQVAVDDTTVYWGGYTFWSAPKSGGEAAILLDGDAMGVVVADEGVYFTTWGALPTSLERLTHAGTFETVLEFNGEDNVPLLARDDEYVYLVPLSSYPAMDARRVRMSDGQVEVVTSVIIAHGFAVAGGFFYVSEEPDDPVMGTRLAPPHVRRVSLDDHTERVLAEFDDYPTGIAADGEYVYVNLQHLTGSKYSGRIIRMLADGSEVCELGSPVDYGYTLGIDDQFVYWVGDRTLWKAPK